MSAPGSNDSTPQRSIPSPTVTNRGGLVSTFGDASSSKLCDSATNFGFACKRTAASVTASKLMHPNVPKSTNSLNSFDESHPMDKLLAKLSEQHLSLTEASGCVKSEDDGCMMPSFGDHASSSNSLPITPATEGFPTTAPTTRPASATLDQARPDADEVLRLKLQLAQAQTHISKLDLELAHSRTGSTMDSGNPNASFLRIPTVQQARENPWSASDDAQSDTSEAMSATSFNRTRGIWGNTKGPFPNVSLRTPVTEASSGHWLGGRGVAPNLLEQPTYQIADGYRSDRLAPDNDLLVRQAGIRRGNRYDARFNASHAFSNTYGGLNSNFEPVGRTASPSNAAMHSNHGGMSMYPQYHHQPLGTPLSPHASEFTSKAASWKEEGPSSDVPTYLPPTEPLNYRRLLDRNVNCNWKYIVDKIVCNNDQQASIFLQQKLKVGTPEQKYEIVEAIVAQAYPLMVNRFGNFLVQRCFEHGTPEQVVKIAEAIRGNTLSLSMDPFGCHVVQKAFDSVPEDYKAIMVHELLRRIPETVIHRYACHVWQKLFELRWTESPPQIMKYVNEALRGMWHEVALGETGSLVVQNIFENCLEDDKRPCIEEVLANIDIVAHGQFGNWCIQHICEHGAPPDRSRAIDHVIRYAAEYSTDQFASKVVEKCLKIGGGDFLGKYLDRVCEGRRDRTRIPLIDIASDQYGNYLIQWILNNATPQHREIVAAHIRKHMVSLRGSKFGSRVGMLCTNHAVTTRPGHSVGGPSIPVRPTGARYNGVYR